MWLVGWAKSTSAGAIMGFFSKIFTLREQNPDSQETTWAFDDNASELVLDAEYANTLASEFDIDAAIVWHEDWKEALRKQLSGETDTQIDDESLRDLAACQLGEWLMGNGMQLLGKYPAFEMLVARHAYFHAQAIELVNLTRAGEYDQALRVYHGGFRHGSNQVVLLLKQLKRGLGR